MSTSVDTPAVAAATIQNQQSRLRTLQWVSSMIVLVSLCLAGALQYALSRELALATEKQRIASIADSSAANISAALSDLLSSASIEALSQLQAQEGDAASSIITRTQRRLPAHMRLLPSTEDEPAPAGATGVGYQATDPMVNAARVCAAKGHSFLYDGVCAQPEQPLLLGLPLNVQGQAFTLVVSASEADLIVAMETSLRLDTEADVFLFTSDQASALVASLNPQASQPSAGSMSARMRLGRGEAGVLVDEETSVPTITAWRPLRNHDLGVVVRVGAEHVASSLRPIVLTQIVLCLFAFLLTFFATRLLASANSAAT